MGVLIRWFVRAAVLVLFVWKARKMPIAGAREQIDAVVVSWPGVTRSPHRFGGVEYLLETREIGHIHGDALVDIPFPSKVRDELVAAGAAEPHHVLPNSGWISFYIREPDDVQRAIDLFRRSYEIALQQQARRTAVRPNGK
jgi:hypothetical protein